MTYLILAEKPSAARNFAKAYGGMTGTYKGQDYKIQSLLGHMTSFAEPHEMVDDTQQEAFKSWSPEFLPWDISALSWRKVPQKTKNMKTGKVASKAPQLNAIKQEAKGCSAIVIATDKDPSGEGQLIGWEVIQAIGWTGDVKRIYFLDESEKELQKGFDNMQDLPRDANQDGEYVKADVRSKWDFISMQLTRLATDATRKKGYDMVIRQGRLKSVMVKLVADQLDLVKAYKKKPYYEVKYKDTNGHTYSRKFDPENPAHTFRFEDKAGATADMAQYATSGVTVTSTTRKETAPGKLLDLGGLASILSAKGYKSKEVLQTYQKMYEARIVSYPRTEDTFISREQFNEMLPHIQDIARVVGADGSLLTHTTPRKSHVKEGGAHGANRPSTNVPASLDDLAKYGKSAKAIYELLARNFLAMFGENYEYDSIKAHITDHPEFTATISVPVNQGFKAIFDTEKETADESDDASEDNVNGSLGAGDSASAFVAEGVNKKPPHPTHKWLERQLGRYDVGTGATRVNTLSEITAGSKKTTLLTDSRGKLNLTPVGRVSAVLLDGSRIGDPEITEELFKSMEQAGDFKQSPDAILQTATDTVRHDKEVFYRNAETLHTRVGAPDTLGADYTRAIPKKNTTAVYAPTGERIIFAIEWGGYTFSQQEIEQLLKGEEIKIQPVSKKTGKPYRVVGRLMQQEYKGKTFWGFKGEFEKSEAEKIDAYTMDNAPFPKEFSGYVFTKADEKALRAGDKIEIQPVSKKTGKPYTCEVTFGVSEYNNKKRWGIIPHFASSAGGSGKKPADAYTLKDAPFKPEIFGYTLSEKEIEAVRAGEKVFVMGKTKAGKPIECNVTLKIKTFKGAKFWGLEPDFG